MENISTIRVMLVDDQSMIRQGLRYIVDLQEGMSVVGEADNGRRAVETALHVRPDVILMDVQMPNMNGIEATREIMIHLPMTKIVILTTFDTEEYVIDGIRAGAAGYLLKDADAADLLSAIQAAHRGEAIYRTAAASDAIMKVLMSTPPRVGSQMDMKPGLSPSEPLTEREMDVLQQMAYGLRNDQIAAALFISEGTVKTHVHRILQKMGVEDRTQAVVLAIRNHWVE